MAAHFLREPFPWNRNHIAMTLFSIAVLILLFVRHRSNLARIWAGTERRVSFGRGRGPKGNASLSRAARSRSCSSPALAAFGLLGRRRSLGSTVSAPAARDHRRPLESARDRSHRDRAAASRSRRLRQGRKPARGDLPAI